MPTSYGVEEARQALPMLLERAHGGESIIITRHGRPIAAVVPIAQARTRPSVDLVSLRGSGAALWTGPDALSAQRDEWT
ncbi:MAG: type II toxin-antitoxin system prevent-host-death family antitoxin [Planctomycetes bacterium]|nr:type II toxin-antitoxin system prevent-host-death family antitoxin [Planctomycetota bacterium]